MKLQPGTSEMKEILETNLEQINLQVNTWRPRNAVECSLSSPTAFQTSAMRWGDTFGWWWQGSSLHRLLREALWAANYWEQSLVPYWTCQPEAPRGRNLLSALIDTTPKCAPIKHFLETEDPAVIPHVTWEGATNPGSRQTQAPRSRTWCIKCTFKNKTKQKSWQMIESKKTGTSACHLKNQTLKIFQIIKDNLEEFGLGFLSR